MIERLLSIKDCMNKPIETDAPRKSGAAAAGVSLH